MLIGASTALVAGILTGFLFRPISLIPVSIILLAAMVYLRHGFELVTWTIGGAMLVTVNVGYLGGALVKHALRNRKSSRTTPNEGIRHRSSS